MIAILLLFIAFVLFLLAAFNVNWRVNFVALGLALWVFALYLLPILHVG